MAPALDKSKNDRKQYKLISLSNGLEALLVSTLGAVEGTTRTNQGSDTPPV